MVIKSEPHEIPAKFVGCRSQASNESGNESRQLQPTGTQITELENMASSNQKEDSGSASVSACKDCSCACFPSTSILKRNILIRAHSLPSPG